MLKVLKTVLSASILFGLACSVSMAQDKPTVAFVPQLVGIPYFDAMEQGGKKAAKDLDLNFIYRGPVDTNPVDQLQIVQNLITQGVDAVGVSVLDASSLTPVVEKAKKQGTKLFTSDSDAPKSGRAVYVAQATNKALGYTLIDELVSRIGEDAKIGIVSGEATATNLNSWIGFMRKRVEEKYPDVTLLDPQYAGGTSQRASQIATDMMTANLDLKAIIAVASTTCPGVGQAIETASKIGQVMGTGYCSPNTVRPFLKSGAFGFSVLWNPERLGYLTAWAGKQLAKDKGFKKENDVPTFDHPISYDADTGVLLLGPPMVFTKKNVDKFDF